MQPKIIAIEGVDGAGKSSLCMLLKGMISDPTVVIAKTPTTDFISLCEAAKKEGQFSSALSFLLGDLAVLNTFRNSSWIILDRYILSTLVYHHEIFESLEVANLFTLLGVTNPTMTVYLSASEQSCQKRLRARDGLKTEVLQYTILTERFKKYLSDSRIEALCGSVKVLKNENVEDQEYNAIQIIKFMQYQEAISK